jgi:hypothetical protein
MRIREFLIGTALMFFAITTKASPPLGLFDEAWLDLAADASNSHVADVRVDTPTAPSRLVAEDKTFASAYYDALNILSTNNPCSDFFGGPVQAVDVFNKLIATVRKEYLLNSIGMRMSGETTNVRDAGTKQEYRLFERVSINANGPFYRKRFSNSEPLMPRIGAFDPNTREVRVLILLHELGHVVKAPNGNWLLPNDGHNEEQSRNNSHKIEDICGEQIKDLRNSEPTLNLAAKKKPDLEIALAKPTPSSQP